MNSEKNKQKIEGCKIGISINKNNAFLANMYTSIPVKFQDSSSIRPCIIALINAQRENSKTEQLGKSLG